MIDLLLLKGRFEKWFRGLTASQLKVFWGAVVLSLITIFMNNPLAGYRISYEYIKVPSMELALARWDENDSYKKWVADSWAREKNYNLNILRKKSWEPEEGYFYRRKNPLWWAFSYESKSYQAWWERSHRDGFSILRFETLGGLIVFLIVVATAAKVLMWLVEVRQA